MHFGKIPMPLGPVGAEGAVRARSACPPVCARNARPSASAREARAPRGVPSGSPAPQGPTQGVSISTALAGTEREYKERVDTERANGSAGMRGA